VNSTMTSLEWALMETRSSSQMCNVCITGGCGKTHGINQILTDSERTLVLCVGKGDMHLDEMGHWHNKCPGQEVAPFAFHIVLVTNVKGYDELCSRASGKPSR